MATLAWLGLGAMGVPMASRLIEAGHDVRVWNRSQDKAAAFAQRATVATSPAEAARDADAVITMLTNPDAVTEVVFGSEGVLVGMPNGGTLIDMSTVGPDSVNELRSKLPEGVTIVDAPVLGSVANAEDGSLKVFVGGTTEIFERWRDTLAPLGKPMHMGPTGAGQAMKLAANSGLAGLITLIGETLALADSLGLDEERAIAGLLESPLGPALKRKLDKITTDTYSPSFKLALMHKDLRLVLEAADQRNVELKVIPGAEQWVAAAHESGFGDLDYSSVVARVRGHDVDQARSAAARCKRPTLP
ncbi:MAG: NAD(P)-dependent oxidoreductase [Actinomycetota bacterium]